MIILDIPFTPVPWAAPKFSRYRTYDPKEKDKRAARCCLASQYKGEILDEIVMLNFTFFFKPPKSATKKQRISMINGDSIPTRCDCTNLQKLYEDCLKGIVIKDDRKVEKICSQKKYAEKEHTIIYVYTKYEQNEWR